MPTYHTDWDNEHPDYQHHYLANLVRTAFQNYNFLEAMTIAMQEIFPDIYYEIWATGGAPSYESLTQEELEEFVTALENKISSEKLPRINVKTKTDCINDYGLDWRFFGKFYPIPENSYPLTFNDGKTVEVKIYDVKKLEEILESEAYKNWKSTLKPIPSKY